MELYKSFVPNEDLRKVLSSVIPSATGVIVSHPMLTLKVNSQVVGGRPRGLYSGMGLYLMKSVPGNSINFMLLQQPAIKKLDPWMQGIIARVTAETIVYPLGLWSTKSQVGLNRSGYFKGWVPTMGRDIVFATVFLQIHRGWLGDGEQALPIAKDLPLPVRIMAAATGASLATQPLDWLKVRAQLGLGNTKEIKRVNMQMNAKISAGWLWRLAYCNVRSVAAWGLFELMTTVV